MRFWISLCLSHLFLLSDVGLCGGRVYVVQVCTVHPRVRLRMCGWKTKNARGGEGQTRRWRKKQRQRARIWEMSINMSPHIMTVICGVVCIFKCMNLFCLVCVGRGGVHSCMCVCVRARACVRACVRSRARATSLCCYGIWYDKFGAGEISVYENGLLEWADCIIALC